MVTPENIVSVGGQHALQEMVELEMYLVSQSQQAPWPMLPRRSKHEPMKPYSKSVESSAAEELVGHGFIEATSRRTFIVSKSGYQFYEREIKHRHSLPNRN